MLNLNHKNLHLLTEINKVQVFMKYFINLTNQQTYITVKNEIRRILESIFIRNTC